MKARSVIVRLLSFLLCLTLVVGVLPATVLRDAFEVNAAEQDSTIVIAASDYQASSDAAGTAVIQKILSQMGYSKVDGVLFAGDYSVNTSSTTTNIANLEKAFTDKLTIANDLVLVQGNHDDDSFVSNGSLSASGAHDAENYGVFVIHEQDYMYRNDDETRIKQTAGNLEKYLNDKIEKGYDKPVFVVSHLPLHYSMRTQVESHDGKHAKYIFDVLNEAGGKGLNIIFLFGHNHSHGWDDPYGGSAIFLTRGDKINIAQHSTTEYTQETLYFTYMNAGYVGYYRHVNEGAETTLTMTAFEITGNEVTVKRYSQDGLYKLKSAGVRNKHAADGSSVDSSCKTNHNGNETYEPDTSTVVSPYKLVRIVKMEDEESGITVSAPGITGVTVEKKSSGNVDDKTYSAYQSYDITVEGYNEGYFATVTIPVPDNFDPSKKVLVLHDGAVIASVPVVDGKITFTTNHFSVYDIAQLAEGEVENWIEIPGETTYTYTQANSITANGKYVIVGGNHNVALMDNNGSMDPQNVTISGSTLTSATPLTEWTFSGSSSGTVNSGAHYLHWSNPYYVSGSFDLSEDSTTLNFAKNGSAFTISHSTGYWTNYYFYYFYYNGSSWTRSNSNSTQNVRLYQFTDTTTTASEYVGMAGQTDYYLVTGRYTDQAAVENMIRTSITVYTAKDSNGTDATETQDYQITGTVNPGEADDYTLTVTYGGKTLGTITIHVSDKKVTGLKVEPMEGSVERGSGRDTRTGSTMTVTYDDETTEDILVTVGMLSGGEMNINQNGTYTDLTISYGGKTVEGYTLNVVNVSGNDYPAYPNGGSVNVDKTATGQDFQNTGVARVDLSVSGLPSQKGVDVVVVIDTSSSMKNNDISGTGKTRIQVLSESLKKMLTNFRQPDTSGTTPDVDIAIIDFNGYSTPISGAKLDDSDYRKADDEAKVFTGVNAGEQISKVGLSAEDFVNSTAIDPEVIARNFTNDTCKSGTNYDSALHNAYTLLSAKKAVNTEDRDQFVIFLSDGAPFRYNGYDHGVKNYDLWSKWLEGYWKDVDALEKAESEYEEFPGSYPEFYNGQTPVTGGTAQPHRFAEAIKGSVSRMYDVVVNTAENTGYIQQYEGLGARIYSIGFGLAADTDSSTNTSVTVDTQKKVLEVLSSGKDYYYPDVQSAGELDEAFNQIVSDIRFAARNAVFKDQMGSAFDLQMNPKIIKDSSKEERSVDTDITVTSRPIYTATQVGTDVGGHTVTANDVGKAYGTGTVLERVTFTVDENGNITAKSGEKKDNILVDGVICANNFWYNTTNIVKTIEVDGSEIQLDPETFYWSVGTINEKQFTLSYAVYLTGSMEGNVSAGSYDTNNYATLSYINWLGNEAAQSVPSPAMPWKGANVSYAFYLVNGNGEPVDQNGNVVTNINTAYKVTQPVLYKAINLNSTGGVTNIETVAKNVLPNGYTLYDTEATYEVSVASGTGTSSWTITGTYPQSTYVTGYDRPQDYSNEANVSEPSYDYTHTTVYFAVVWTVGAVQDTVVIDYGLPVDISALANDLFGNLGKLVAVGPYTEGMEQTHTDALNAGFDNSYGDARIEQGKVRYTPGSMKMEKPVVFAYAVEYTGGTNPGYYYGKITVIPATTVYFEDSFLTLESFTGNEKDEPSKWTQKGTVVSATQGEDRPGGYSRPEYDANNLYGYDGAYTGMSTYSMGSAAKIHVDADTYGTASFTFYGTGFDVISMTSNTTGVLAVQVNKDGKSVKSTVVNTYYGYKCEQAEDGSVVWTPGADAEYPLYQVPVMRIEGLPYGKYTVTITATYVSALDKTAEEGYDLYLDAIRIYDPTGNVDEVANEAYVADGEGWPVYEELRNNIIAAKTFDISKSEAVSGIVFIDGNDKVTSIADYVSYGPNNELYLAQGQAIAFNVTAGKNVADIQLGIKAASSGSVTYTINGVGQTVSTTTDLYYSIKDFASGTVVIRNTSDGILSLTNIKVTHTEAPAAETETQGLLWMDGPSAAFALMSLRPEPAVAVFAPEKLEVSLRKTQVTVGDEIRGTVKTGEDVAYITVNGETVTDYRANRRTGERTWTVSLTAESAGELTVDVVAFNAEGVASETVTNTVTVAEKKTPADIIRDILDDLIGWIFG